MRLIHVPRLSQKKKAKQNTWLRNLMLRAQGDLISLAWIVTVPKILGYHCPLGSDKLQLCSNKIQVGQCYWLLLTEVQQTDIG